MRFVSQTYISADSVIHRTDARVKLILLLSYSITLFMIDTWIGLLLCIAFCVGICVLSKTPVSKIFVLLVPLYVILAFTLLFNSFTFDIAHIASPSGLGSVSAGVFASIEPLALFGSFGFVPAGFARGSFYALRIIFLVVASLVLSFTTTSTALIDALNSFLRPLRCLRVPVDDISMIISIALRFIPVTAEELGIIRDAQASRGANFDTGSLLARIKAWQPVLIPLFVGLFRRSSMLALAMEARCYGLSKQRSHLHTFSFSPLSGLLCAGGILICVLCSIYL